MAEIPQHYALALWLRDLGCTNDEIASVLEIATEAVSSLLTIGELKVRGPLSIPGGGRRGILVFLEDADEGLVDEATTLARRRDARLHLVALRAAAGDASQDVVDLAARAIRSGVEIVPVAVDCRGESALKALVTASEPITVLRRLDWRLDHPH